MLFPAPGVIMEAVFLASVPYPPEFPMSRTKLAVLALSLVIVAGLSPEATYAETRTAAALTPEAVWEAIDAAKDGDTVQLPDGTAVWTKGWNTGHGAKMKAITIQGAGIDKTVIGDDRSMAGNGAVRVAWEWKASRSASRASPSTERDTPTPASGGGLMCISGTCKNFRIDHCKFKNADHMLTIERRHLRAGRPLLL